MRNLALSVTLLILLFSQLSAQEYCRKTIVYFDFGKANLKSSEKEKLEELIAGQPAAKFYVELMGHTDAIDDDESNMRLSEARAASVAEYLHTQHSDLTFKSWYYGESKPVSENESDRGRAQNRRVEVYLIPMEGELLSFKGTRKEQIDVPKSFFGDCPICDSKPRITTFLTADEADRGGFPLVDENGNEMITSGMTSLDFDCSNKPDTCVPIEIRIPAPTFDPRMIHYRWNPQTLRWQASDGKVSWKDGFFIMEVCGMAGKIDNLDTCIIRKGCELHLIPGQGMRSQAQFRTTERDPGGSYYKFRKGEVEACDLIHIKDLARRKKRLVLPGF